MTRDKPAKPLRPLTDEQWRDLLHRHGLDRRSMAAQVSESYGDNDVTCPACGEQIAP